MTQPSSPEFYEDFLDLSWIDRCFHLDLFCLSSTVHLLWTQIPTPAPLAPPIEKANLSQKTQSRCGFPKLWPALEPNTVGTVPAADLRLLLLDFSCGTCSETLSDAFSWSSSAWSKIVVESVGCNLPKRTESSGIVPTKSGAAKDPAEVKHESTVWLFRDVLTVSDILIGIDFVRCKM